MYQPARGITREEIAQIHDSIADKIMETGGNVEDQAEAFGRMTRARRAARDIRATDRLFGPIGTRSA